jgi:uncharacterized membrane protein SpoIIM required for sporulation/ABC-type transport system involved in multi-copper enzyme maturation permease subunit
MFQGALLVARREIRDQIRDWRIATPIVLLTLFFPLLMNFTAGQAVSFVSRYGAEIIGERLIPFLLMVVGFFPVSISLVIALESFAGERERLTLEPLLATPLDDRQIYLGKTIASLAMPLGAAYLGILVYLIGLAVRIQWYPPPQLLLQVILLTTAQACLMVSAAVVISSQATSVRAANLLASLIIVPVSQLIIGESMIMFWARYDALWAIVIGLVMLSLVLARMGMRLFNREQMLGREIDAIDLRWAWGVFKRAFVGRARSLAQWYAGLLRESLPAASPAIALMAIALLGGFLLGMHEARIFTLPADIFALDRIQDSLHSELAQFGFLSARGFAWILFTNLRALAAAGLLGLLSFGVLAVLLLMAPMAIVGYFAGNIALAGQSAGGVMLALVAPHGVAEIPATLIAGAAILRIWLAVLGPPGPETLGERWVRGIAEWARLTFGLVVPLLLVAALLEAFVTPLVAVRLLFTP